MGKHALYEYEYFYFFFASRYCSFPLFTVVAINFLGNFPFRKSFTLNCFESWRRMLETCASSKLKHMS